MRILLDENVPRKLCFRFGEAHEVSTVPEIGWAGTKNGALLARADGRFDVLVTVDTNLEFQQNLSGLTISVIVVEAISNTYEDVVVHIPAILSALESLSNGTVVRVSV